MSKKQMILIVEDERSISNFMTTILEANDYKVMRAQNGQEATMMMTSYCPDLILLDLGLPDVEGMHLIKFVRKWSSVPIIVVSARSHERDKVEALDLGADDYVTKPFATAELLARIRTALRHFRNAYSQGAEDLSSYSVGDFKIDFDKRKVTIGEESVHLTQIEYKIVAMLSRYAGRVLTYDSIIQNIWGPHVKEDNQILRVNMANIRRKLEKNPAQPKYIYTEVGVGYRMAEEK